MIIRKRKKPLPLKKLEALISRLPENHPKRPQIERDIAIRYKGYIGEQKVDYHLEQLPKPFSILLDVCLNIQGRQVQIDSLIISPHAIYFIEVKNFEDQVTFDTNFNQFIRNANNKEEGFRSPIAQAESTLLNLSTWLEQRNFSSIPIYYFIAIADPSTIINVDGDPDFVRDIVAHADQIPIRILEMENMLSNEKMNPSEQLATREKNATDRNIKAININANKIRNIKARNINANKIRNTEKRSWKIPVQRIADMINSACLEFDIDIMRQHGIHISELLPGVKCPDCNQLGMERGFGTWICNHCERKNKFAHQRAISDYFLLIRPWITNKELMYFLKINSRRVATRILQSSNLVYQNDLRRWIKNK